MPRTTTPWCICLASFGRCSLISTPGALVLIGLNSPAPLLSGLRSNVSLWLGPPSIHSRMHDLALPAFAAGAALARLARTSSHPDIDAAPTPAAPSWRNLRRVVSARRLENMGIGSGIFGAQVIGGKPTDGRPWASGAHFT